MWTVVRRMCLAVVVGLAVPCVTGSAQDAGAKPPEVRTSATAIRWVVPDFASFRVNLQGKGPTPLKAAQDAAGKAIQIRNALAKLGVHPDSVVNPRTWYWQGRIESSTVERVIDIRDPLTGRIQRVAATDSVCGTGYNRNSCNYRQIYDTVYRASDVIEVRIRNLAVLGAAIDSVLATGVPSIEDVKATATDASAAYTAALREATEVCVQRARIIAEASGGKLGLTQSIGTDYERESSRIFTLEQVVVTGVSDAPGTKVLVPNVKVSATVYGRWNLLTR